MFPGPIVVGDGLVVVVEPWLGAEGPVFDGPAVVDVVEVLPGTVIVKAVVLVVDPVPDGQGPGPLARAIHALLPTIAMTTTSIPSTRRQRAVVPPIWEQKCK
jgi:hypothetical protein